MLVREGGIRNFFPNFGIEDRGDSGGVVSPVSKPEALEAQLRKYAAVHVEPNRDQCGEASADPQRSTSTHRARGHITERVNNESNNPS
jgi:hypothetical protein